MKRTRRTKSIADDLVNQSREAALSAIQIFNNPISKFKSEAYIVLMMIAWTYLLHAHCRRKGIDFRYSEKSGKRRRFLRTKDKQYRFWDLTKCLNVSESPIDKDTTNNLRFLIGLRHVIEHKMADDLDDYLSGRYHACALNFETYVTRLHGDRFSIGDHLSYTIQFRDLAEGQLIRESEAGISTTVRDYISNFDNSLKQDELNSPRFSERLLFTRKLVNHPGQADRVVEFLDPESAAGKELHELYVVLKEVRKEVEVSHKKFRAGQIVEKMQMESFVNFKMYDHIQLWKSLRAQGDDRYGEYPTGEKSPWCWYENWIAIVRNHCEENRHKYCN